MSVYSISSHRASVVLRCSTVSFPLDLVCIEGVNKVVFTVLFCCLSVCLNITLVCFLS
jgi:hypothetical protein